MHVGHIKLLFYQSPNMLEQITSLGRAIDFFFRIKLNRLYFPRGQIYFADMSVDQDKGVFVFFIEKELSRQLTVLFLRSFDLTQAL